MSTTIPGLADAREFPSKSAQIVERISRARFRFRDIYESNSPISRTHV
jgi:hypothetical protein